jgi:hypothetical protein
VVVRGTKRHGAKSGIGLYSYEQEKNTTAFQYFAQTVIGAIVCALGTLCLVGRIMTREGEIAAFGSAEPHVWDWLTSLAIVVIGLFWAHAGIIFYARRLGRRLFGSGRGSHGTSKHRATR